MKILFILVPTIGAAASWLIISLAVQLLFRPVDPVRLPLLGIEIIGILPKKRQELAAGIGQIIRSQLEMAVTGQNQAAVGFRGRMTKTVVSSVREHLEGRIPFLVPNRIKNAIIASVTDVIEREIPEFYDTFADNVMSADGAGGILEKLALDKISNFDLQELFVKVNHSREIVLLKSAAAVIGFVAGLFQLLLLMWAAA